MESSLRPVNVSPYDQDLLPEELKRKRNEVLEKYRSKLSPNLAKLSRSSEAIARQFLVSAQELDEFGTVAPFEEGRENRGTYGLERVYEDRAVITPYFECAAYCRYCFKKARTLGGEGKRMSEADLEGALHFVAQRPEIKTVLITGGDPMMDVPFLKKTLDGVAKIPHVRNIRVGTRHILFRPQHITDEVADFLASYNRLDPENLSQSLNLSLGISINHIDELSSQVVQAIQKFIKRGVLVRGQITLLKGINDSTFEMERLLAAFHAVNIVPYYLFHCMPVRGARHFRTPVQKGIDILRELAPKTGAGAPLYVYVTPIGKHRLNWDSKLEHVNRDGTRYIRKKTPYRAADFLEYTGKSQLPPLHEVDADGYIVSHYPDED